MLKKSEVCASDFFRAFLSVFNRAEMCYNGTNFMVGIHRTNLKKRGIHTVSYTHLRAHET